MRPASRVFQDVGRGIRGTVSHEANEIIGGHTMKIFLVEDSAPIRERLAEMIREIRGVDVVGEAENYRDAVAGIARTKPDVVILDIKLAGDEGSGIDVLNEVRRSMPAVRAMMLSNYATPQYLRASADAGAEYFLDKSADFEKIVEILVQMRDGGPEAA